MRKLIPLLLLVILLGSMAAKCDPSACHDYCTPCPIGQEEACCEHCGLCCPDRPTPTPIPEPEPTETPAPTVEPIPTIEPTPTETIEPTPEPTKTLLPTPTLEPTLEPTPIPVVHYKNQRFIFNIDPSWTLEIHPYPMEGRPAMRVENGEIPRARFLRGVPTTIHLWWPGITPHLAGIITVHGDGPEWNIWFVKGPDGKFYLCNADKGVFNNFTVTDGLNCP